MIFLVIFIIFCGLKLFLETREILYYSTALCPIAVLTETVGLSIPDACKWVKR